MHALKRGSHTVYTLCEVHKVSAPMEVLCWGSRAEVPPYAKSIAACDQISNRFPSSSHSPHPWPGMRGEVEERMASCLVPGRGAEVQNSATKQSRFKLMSSAAVWRLCSEEGFAPSRIIPQCPVQHPLDRYIASLMYHMLDVSATVPIAESDQSDSFLLAGRGSSTKWQHVRAQLLR
eukprot:6464093-Amphidinium_carterae.1